MELPIRCSNKGKEAGISLIELILCFCIASILGFSSLFGLKQLKEHSRNTWNRLLNKRVERSIKGEQLIALTEIRSRVLQIDKNFLAQINKAQHTKLALAYASDAEPRLHISSRGVNSPLSFAVQNQSQSKKWQCQFFVGIRGGVRSDCK